MITAHEPAPANGGTMPKGTTMKSSHYDPVRNPHDITEKEALVLEAIIGMTQKTGDSMFAIVTALRAAERSGWERGREAAARFVETPEPFLIDGKGASKSELAMGIRLLQPETRP